MPRYPEILARTAAAWSGLVIQIWMGQTSGGSLGCPKGEPPGSPRSSMWIRNTTALGFLPGLTAKVPTPVTAMALALARRGSGPHSRSSGLHTSPWGSGSKVPHARQAQRKLSKYDVWKLCLRMFNPFRTCCYWPQMSGLPLLTLIADAVVGVVCRPRI